jgi:hypothetical protein
MSSCLDPVLSSTSLLPRHRPLSVELLRRYGFNDVDSPAVHPQSAGSRPLVFWMVIYQTLH